MCEAYLGNNFKTMLKLLNCYLSRHALDIYFAPHVTEPTNMMYNWALVPYFQPLANKQLTRSTGCIEAIEPHLTTLVPYLINPHQLQASCLLHHLPDAQPRCKLDDTADLGGTPDPGPCCNMFAMLKEDAELELTPCLSLVLQNLDIQRDPQIPA
ncbi:hypothetical protein B0H13DRAFT_2317806 [Mycena leptocephala]|nr:hypothetical protein B0H13DRAFT_2317806 [Mycena leptocephala]